MNLDLSPIIITSTSLRTLHQSLLLVDNQSIAPYIPMPKTPNEKKQM